MYNFFFERLIILQAIRVRLKLKNNPLEQNVLDIGTDSISYKIIRKFFLDKSQEFINQLYKNKEFSCLVCAFLLKKIFIYTDSLTLNIGVTKKNNKAEFHAWVEQDKTIVFGQIKNLINYKVLYKI